MNALILGLLATANFRLFPETYQRFIVLSAGLFALFDLVPIRWLARFRRNAQNFWVVLTVALIVVGPLAQSIIQRQLTSPSAFIHDGALQTEEAIKLLLSGKNPYGADYSQTALADWPYWISPDASSNPALEHYTYLPLSFIGVIPFYFIAQVLLGWFDIRLVYLLCFVVIWILLPLLTQDREKQLALQIVFGLNPLFAPFIAEGRNDVTAILWIVLALALLQRRRFTWTAVMLGLACVTKQTVWFVVPFFLAYLFFISYSRQMRSFLVRVLIPFVLPFVLVVLPFLIWDAGAFVKDTLIYPSTTYPVLGIGLGGLLVTLGILPARDAAFPFGLVEMVVGVPVLALLLRYVIRSRSIRSMVAASAGFAFLAAYLNRVFHDNYIGFVLTLAVIAFFVEESHSPPNRETYAI